MDERLEKALEFANYRITLGNRKRDIRAHMLFLQTLHYINGVFFANETIIGFIDALLRQNKTKSIVVDTNENPVEIEDLQEFMDLLLGAYSEASNEYKVQMDKVTKSRNIKKIMDW